MLLVDEVHKSYGSREVLRGVNLRVELGEICGLIGSNGAGKTTLISIAAGLITHDGGSVRVGKAHAADVDVARQPRRAAGLIGLAPQELGVYPMLSVRENLQTFAELAGTRGRRAHARVEEVAHALDLVPHLNQRADTLSGGQARRLHTGMALLHRPEVLFLDEPTVGADVSARRAILEVVKELAKAGTAVVYTSHYLGELDDLGASVAILHGGRIVLEGSVREVVSAHARPTLSIVTSGTPPVLPGWKPKATPDGMIRWDASDDLAGSEASSLADALARLGASTTLEAVDVTPASLESAFLAVTGQRLTASPTPSNSQESHDVAYA